MRRIATGYLIAQAVAVAAWWAALAVSEDVRARFELDGERPQVLAAFVAADLVLLGAGSLVAAAAVHREHRAAGPLTAGVAVAAAYPTLQLSAWVAQGGAGAIGLAPMAAATLMSTVIAVDAARR